MKRLLFAIIAMAAITLVSCSKDEEKSLNGTVWVESGIKLTFTSNLECEFAFVEDDVIIEYTYTYSHPDVIMSPIGYDDLADMKGVIDGDRMKITNMSSNETVFNMTKR